MKFQILPLLGLVIISSTAFAGSDTVTCKSASGAVAFDVGNGSNTISIKMKNKKSGKITTLTSPAKLMPYYDYNTEETDKTMSVLPISDVKMLKSNNQVQVVYDKNGKLKCSGRELTDETYSQSVLVTAKSYNRENQGLDYAMIEANVIPGIMKDTGYLKADVTCHHEQVTTAGGCFADEGDTVKIEPSK
jgi:hypothetical protein